MFRGKSKAKTSSNLGSRESLDSKTSSGKSPYSSSDNLKEPSILNRNVTFSVSLIGVLESVNLTPATSEETDTVLVERIENAQINGKLPVNAQEDVNFVISKHGIRLTAPPTSNGTEEVKWRFPLHSIGQLLTYESPTGKYNLVLTIGQVGKFVFNCYVFQCQSLDQSQAACNSLKAIFSFLAQKS